MLVLSRRINEGIVIDSSIEVRVLKTATNRVILGFSAPRGVPICRGELEAHRSECQEEEVHVSVE